MNLDELINALLEAKEHCVDGRANVIIQRHRIPVVELCPIEVKYDSNQVYIIYE